MTTLCFFRFDGNDEVVYTGNNFVSGSIKLITGNPKYATAIEILMRGYVEINRSSAACRTVDLYSHTNFVRGGRNGTVFVLEPGESDYPFRYLLPENVAPTYRDKYANIKHEVGVIIHSALAVKELYKKEILVDQTINLNLNDIYKVPINAGDDKTITSCCYTHGTLKAQIYTPYSGYARGQNIPYTIIIENDSTVDCDIILKLKRCIEYGSLESDKFQCRERIHEKKVGKVNKYTNKEFKDTIHLSERLRLSMLNCSQIKLSYYLKLDILAPKCYFCDLSVRVPIVIGDIPLVETLSDADIAMLESNSNESETSPESTTPLSIDRPPAYARSFSQPPSYSEALQSNVANIGIA